MLYSHSVSDWCPDAMPVVADEAQADDISVGCCSRGAFAELVSQGSGAK